MAVPSSLIFLSSKPFKDLVTPLYPLPVILLTIIPHPQRRTSAIIIESNGYIQARQFLQDLAKQAAFYRHIPWHNLYLFYLSLISISLQSTLYRSLLTHITALHHPPPLSITLTDADIASAQLHS